MKQAGLEFAPRSWIADPAIICAAVTKRLDLFCLDAKIGLSASAFRAPDRSAIANLGSIHVLDLDVCKKACGQMG